MGEDTRRFRRVDHGEGESDMDQNVIADLRLGHISEADFLDHATEIDPSGADQRIVARERQDQARNR